MASVDASCFFGSTEQSYDLATDDDIAQLLSSDESLEEPDLNGPTTLHCEICSKKFDNAKKYYGHLWIHSKDNPWKCDKCPDMRFSTKQQLTKHSLIHKPLERVWKCQQCELAFKDLWALQQHHFAIHLKYRPMKCNLCSKSFYKQSDLNKHKDTHSDIRKHKCKQCDKAFKDKSNLTRHIVTHTKQKQFICPGCSAQYTQHASLNRHKQKCALVKHLKPQNIEKNCIQNLIFDAPRNTNITENSENSKQNDVNKTVHNIVDDILSAEDDFVAMGLKETNSVDGFLTGELFKEINVLSRPVDEILIYEPAIDISQTNSVIKLNTCPQNVPKNKENDNRSPTSKEEFVNALYLENTDSLPNDTLDIYKNLVIGLLSNLVTNTTVTVNESSTIFESDVDIEASTNLAANLDKLIGINGVKYIYTDDEKFVISLDNVMNAQQLIDVQNVEYTDNLKIDESNDKISAHVLAKQELDNGVVTENFLAETEKTTQCNQLSLNVADKDVKVNKLAKKYTCNFCNKVFNRKYNYKSHLGVHVASQRSFRCGECERRFAYRCSLVRHRAATHAAAAPRPHRCPRCDNTYRAKWQVSEHVKRDHDKLTPHACAAPGCTKSFYKKGDLILHSRHHTGERPFACSACRRGFAHRSHLARHLKSSCCLRKRRAPCADADIV